MPAPRKVSVIIGTRDRPALLRNALKSIRALEGDDLVFEILIGDNGGLPETKAVAEEFGAYHEVTDKNGCAAARNLALRQVTGEFVALLDDDDIWLEDHIRPHIAHLDANPDCAAVFGQVVFADHQMRRRPDQWRAAPPQDGDIFRMMMSGYFPQVGATVIRRSIADRIGLMDETLIGDSDWDWQMRITRDWPTAIIEAECVLFRGKAPGGSDKLLWMRTKYTRKIFFRHLWANRRRWPTTASVIRSYFGSMETYYAYFMESAATKSGKGQQAARLLALWRAFLLYPTRLIRHAASDSEVRELLLGRSGADATPS